METSKTFVKASTSFVETSAKLVGTSTTFAEGLKTFVEASTNFVGVSTKLVEVSRSFVETFSEVVEVSKSFVEVSQSIFKLYSAFLSIHFLTKIGIIKTRGNNRIAFLKVNRIPAIKLGLFLGFPKMIPAIAPEMMINVGIIR